MNALRYARTAEWKERNKEKMHAQRVEYGKRNADKIRDRKARSAVQTSIRHRQYYLANKHYFKAKDAERRAAKLQRCVSWANKEAIAKIYREAAEKGLHVDHVVPLRGKFVSGLHVENNLQLLSPAENLRKRNKFDPASF